jgi:N-acetylmuramoyl-L-alanine amidase
MARRVFLSAGHSNVPGKDQGASGVKDPNGKAYVEGVLAVELTELVKRELIAIGVTPAVDGYSNILAETMTSFTKLVGKKDLAIEFHWNAASPAATGTEVLIPGRAGINEATSFEIDAANKIAGVFAASLGIKNRGVKLERDSARKKLGWMRIPCENILVEVCFISNVSDMASWEKNKVQLAKNLATTIKSLL